MNTILSLATGVATLAVVAQTAQAQLSFDDQTLAAGVNVIHTRPAGHDPEPGDEMYQLMRSSAAAIDYDRDGFQDFFILGGGLRRDRLFHNNGDGTFTNRALQAGIGVRHMGCGIAVGDYDNDGWLDLFVTSHGSPANPKPGRHFLWRNNGDGTFTNNATAAGVAFSSLTHSDGFGACFGDYDLDGDLDLFVGGWRMRPIPAYGNRLFENNGDGTFSDVTVAAGVEITTFHGFSPCFADMNGDKYPELLVAADFRTSQYFINNQDGTFTNSTVVSGLGLDSNGMGSAVADMNNDGLLDWYVTSINQPWQPNLKRDGNKLYMNQGNHVYVESAKAAGVDAGGWGWGTVAVDFNHDGWLDLAETNGWVWIEFTGDPAYMWINNQDGTYTDVAGTTGFAHTGQGRGMLNFDYDNDGDQDVLICSNKEMLTLFRNDLVHDATTAWLRVELDTSANPGLAPNGMGAMVRATVGGQTYLRCIDGGSHFLAQSELFAHFGLGSATVIDTLEVEWSDGTFTTLNNVAVNQTMTIVAP